jgi:hypothetical protein
MWFPVHSSKDSSKSLIKKPLPFAGEASLSFGLEAADNTEGGEQGRCHPSFFFIYPRVTLLMAISVR